MTYWLSKPIESLFREQTFGIADLATDDSDTNVIATEVDYLIIGSGYGAAMATLALLEHRDDANFTPRIWVFERGDEYVPDDFPKTVDDLPSYLNYVSAEPVGNRTQNVQNRTGLWEIRSGERVSVLTGSGLGGTSLVNANVAARPNDGTLENWPQSEFSDETWPTLFASIYPKIEALLGVSTVEDPHDFPKYRALEDTADGLNGNAQPARLTIDFDNDGSHSVDSGACNRCGNCVIGCHSGAKQSLNMNAWPLARQMGGNQVRMYTGVSTLTVHRGNNADPLWTVTSALTRKPDHRFIIHAKNVILAAGTLGSAEILQRSQHQNNLSLSDRLGQHFSTNGDALISSVGQQHPVNATCDIPGRPIPPARRPGPTIVGIAEADLGHPDHPDETFTLEDGAIPFPLLPLWQELLVTQSFLKRYESSRLSAWHRDNPDHDYLAISRDLNEHSQVLLAMGDDRALGNIDYDTTSQISTPRWPPSSNQFDFFEALDERFRTQQAYSLNGGQYLPNILWQPIPPEFANAVAGVNNLPSSLLSVHPLGGCGIGLTAGTGVVNTRGQVFSGATGTEVHDGLYVLDGAIIPGAIGVNPFMTIAATSYLLAFQLASADANLPNGRDITADFPDLDSDRPDLRFPTGALNPMPSDDQMIVGGVFRERLVHYLGRSTLLPWSIQSDVTVADINRLFAPAFTLPDAAKALVLDIEISFEGQNHLDNWLENPNTRLAATAELSFSQTYQTLTVETDSLEPIARLQGTVNLGIIDRPGWRFWRFVTQIVGRFWRFRKSEIFSASGGGNWWQKIVAIVRVGNMHTDFREMEYHFNFDPTDQTSSDLQVTIQGRKTIGYSNRYLSLWGSILAMTGVLAASGSGNRRSIDFGWELDSVDITDGRAPLQIRDALNLIHVLTRVLGGVTYFLRVALQTHLLSFGAPDYPNFRTKRHMDSIEAVVPPLEPELSRLFPPPEIIHFGPGNSHSSTPVEIETHLVDSPDTPIVEAIRLLRYQPAENDNGFDTNSRKTLLLIHGLAHGSRIFWTDTIDVNFVQYFLARNYDIWILDHRTSPNFVSEVTIDHRWDDIALIDVPWAVEHIYDVINAGNIGARKKIHVFSHCIGAGAASIAALSGLFNDPGTNESMLKSLVPHAVAPWLFASMTNRARTNLWGLVKDAQPLDVAEPCPHQDTGLVENLLDRIATSTLTRYENDQWHYRSVKKDSRGRMFPRAIYTRYTIIWGRQWVNENINRDTRNQFAGMIGAVPRDVLQQVYSSIVRGMLTNHYGNNAYVTRDNIQNNWNFPTLFIHGDKNTVFDIETSRKSAEMLTRHRLTQPADTVSFGDITPADYYNSNVWIETVPGYGHMDMILGADAYQNGSVFDRLDRFFDAAERDEVSIEYANDFTTADELDEFREQRRAGSRVEPSYRPLTGPIISNPEIVNGELVIRIWVEAQDFSTIPVTQIHVEGPVAAQVQLLRMRPAPQPIVELPLIGAEAEDPFDEPEGPAPLLAGPSHVPASSSYEPAGPLFFPPLYFETRHDFFAPNPDDIRPSRSSFSQVDEIFWLVEYRFTPGLANNLLPAADANPEFELVRYLWLGYDEASTRPDSAIELRWDGLDWLNRILNPAPARDPEICFVIGSCHYPGTAIDIEQMTEVYNGMYAHVLRDTPDPTDPGTYRRGVDHIMLVGDQIYADATAGIMDPIIAYEKYRDRYRRAWGNPPARRLFSHVPTYFAVDDHEYDDNYQGDLPGRLEPAEEQAEMDYAINMAWQFQMHARDSWRNPRRLWYHFESAGFPFFVFDTRLERQSSHPQGRESELSLMNNAQIEGFSTWLSTEAQDSDVIFIASGSPIAPVRRAQQLEPFLLEGGDNLLAYPGFLTRIARLLQQLDPGKRVCWLTGDPHISCYAHIELELDAPDDRVALTQVCASGTYAPVSFINVNANACDWGAARHRLQLAPNLAIHYSQFLITDHHQHFVRMCLNEGNPVQPTLTLSAYDATGSETNRLFEPTRIGLEQLQP